MRHFSKLKAFEPFLWIYYIWYYLPIVRVFFRSSTYNYIFFAFFIGAVSLCFIYAFVSVKNIKVEYNALVPVLLYMAVFLLFVLLDFHTASRHIRISFTFWGTLMVYFFTSPFPDSQKRLSFLFLSMLFITTVTSTIGVILNPSAARTLAYASNDIQEDIVVRLLNIGGIAFFQGLAICSPILVTFFKNNKYKWFSLIAIIIIFISLLFASFAISLLMLCVAVLLSLLSNSKSQSTIQKFGIGILVLLLIAVVPWSNLFYFLSDIMPNDSISVRFASIASSLADGFAGGNLDSRLQTYVTSLNTFLENPLGVGPHYTFVTMENGIGYHSQFFDDLARYGIFAIAFYVAFFFGYYKLLLQQWSKINMKQVVLPVVIVYFLFLCLNPGFTSEHEGVLVLFLIPAIPDLLFKKEENLRYNTLSL